MPVLPTSRVARRRGVALLGLLLLMQGPAALTTLQGRMVLLVLGVAVLVAVDRALAASWCSSRRRRLALLPTTVVLFVAQEVYSGIGVAWVNHDQHTAHAQSLTEVVGQHLLALLLAAAVALLVCGIRAAGAYVGALIRLVAPVAGVVARPPRVVVQPGRAVRRLELVVAHYGLRSPPRCLLPS